MSVAARADEVRESVAAAARRAGRDPGGVRIIAVTKGVPVERVREAVAAGLCDLGESRAQELVAKVSGLPAGAEPTWHFLGRIQRNKVPSLSGLVTWWHSVARPEEGEAIARRAPGAFVLVEVNVDADPAKAGCSPDATPFLVDRLRGAGVPVKGLMAIPAIGGDRRRAFSALRLLGEESGLAELSMGMSGDYDIAVEEGATMVRIGKALFGPRPATLAVQP